MEFADFLALQPDGVASLIAEKKPDGLGIGLPYNGTRRWYLAACNQPPEALYSQDYSVQTRRRLWAILEMLFLDGVTAVYSPMMGHDLLERGPEYMAFTSQAIGWLADDDALQWYQEHQIAASCYGEVHLLPAPVQARLLNMAPATSRSSIRRYVRYGIFADKETPDLVAHTLRLYQRLGKPPSEAQLREAYYGGLPVQLHIWLGTDQPSIFDVPLVANGHTALYFLQFPTPYLDFPLWRRLLYDYLFVRGDEESLYPENVSSERLITGLGTRRSGYWQPTTT